VIAGRRRMLRALGGVPLGGAIGIARVGTIVGVMGIAGCATPRPPGLAEDAPRISGRMALKVSAYQGAPQRNVNAQFELLGDAAAGELRLVTAIGTTAARAAWSADQVTLSTGDGTRSFTSLQAMSQEALGEAVPLPALFDWLRGRPSDAAGAPSAGGASDARFVQQGWAVDLSRYSEGWVTITRDAPPAVNLRVIVER
jgi:outer membrane lipoprotein LolB